MNRATWGVIVFVSILLICAIVYYTIQSLNKPTSSTTTKTTSPPAVVLTTPPSADSLLVTKTNVTNGTCDDITVDYSQVSFSKTNEGYIYGVPIASTIIIENLLITNSTQVVFQYTPADKNGQSSQTSSVITNGQPNSRFEIGNLKSSTSYNITMVISNDCSTTYLQFTYST